MAIFALDVVVIIILLSLLTNSHKAILMRIHILGICGTFMAGIAAIAKQLGHDVAGCDAQVYPPMSTQLAVQGITLFEGYEAAHLQPAPDLVIVGNAMKRGNPAVEYLLAAGIPYISGPQWLADNVLAKRWVLAVAGTHGKTTTASLLAWILEYAGFEPGFLIGGVPENFGVSARFGGKTPFFVIEADEYDSAFFDKRSKFIHYRPRTLILNNLEFDHADIFPNLEAIKQQFHFLIRTVPNNGLLIQPAVDDNIADVLQRGCWTPCQTFGAESGWHAQTLTPEGSQFEVYYQQQLLGTVAWSLIGKHNINNALAAIAAAQHVGVTPAQALMALAEFKNVKRRLEIKGQVDNITVYDDFAHHPTAIDTTLNGLRSKVGKARIIAVLELASFTMRSGVHKEHLAKALVAADEVYFARPQGADWGLTEVAKQITAPTQIHNDVTDMVAALKKAAKPGDHILIMSNTGFKDIHHQLLAALQQLKTQ